MDIENLKEMLRRKKMMYDDMQWRHARVGWSSVNADDKESATASACLTWASNEIDVAVGTLS